nr:hypothetical protein Iba_chr03aCG1180 [Ipomoea batatas]
MYMFTCFSFEKVQHIREDYIFTYFLHTLHGHRYCIFEISKQQSHSKYTFVIAQMWLVLMKVMGFQLTFPANINTKRRVEQFLETFLQGSINIDFGRLRQPSLFLYTNRRTSSPSVCTNDYLVFSARAFALDVGISLLHAYTPPSACKPYCLTIS